MSEKECVDLTIHKSFGAYVVAPVSAPVSMILFSLGFVNLVFIIGFIQIRVYKFPASLWEVYDLFFEIIAMEKQAINFDVFKLIIMQARSVN